MNMKIIAAALALVASVGGIAMFLPREDATATQNIPAAGGPPAELHDSQGRTPLEYMAQRMEEGQSKHLAYLKELKEQKNKQPN